MTDLVSIWAVILAGGLGTRLRAVVSDRPKVLAEVAGRPFITYLLKQLDAAGVRHVVLCTGYQGEQVEAALGSNFNHIRLYYSREFSPLGTGGALRFALPLLQSETILAMNGDSYCRADLEDMLRTHHQRAAKVTLLLAQTSDTSRYGLVQVAADDTVASFNEKIPGQGPGLISAGIYLLSREVLQEIPPDQAVSLEQEIFPSFVGNRMFGHLCQGNLFDIGTAASYRDANNYFGTQMFNNSGPTSLK